MEKARVSQECETQFRTLADPLQAGLGGSASPVVSGAEAG
jgi:hypothetical protein